MKKMLISSTIAFIVVCLGLSGCSGDKTEQGMVNAEQPQVQQQSVSDSEIGFRSDLTSEDLVLPTFEQNTQAAGESVLVERSFENAPPLISHTIEDMLPITTDNNMCISCHLPEFAKDLNATSVPKSHMADLRDEKQTFVEGKLSMARYDCVSCHVAQTNAKALVQNNFNAEFRYGDSKSNSNLLDVLNQGAE